MAVSERLVLLYEPEWVATTKINILATALAHECLHDQLRHIARGNMYADKKRFNRAGDLFINGTMAQQTRNVRVIGRGNTVVQTVPLWEFPEWALMPEKYGFPNGLTADAYYHLLEKFEAAQASKKQKSKGANNEQGDPDQGDEENEKGAQESQEQGQGHGHGKGKVMAGCCGGVAGNPALEDLERTLNNTIGRTEADCRQKAKETANAIKAHIATGRGDTPGLWKEFTEASETEFQVPWATKLARTGRSLIGNLRNGGTDYSIRRPSRRSYLRGFPLPGLIAYEPTVWIVMDSSGSMGAKQLGDGLRVCIDILRQTGITYVWYLEADTKVQADPIRISARDLQSRHISGRGGTDFREAIAMADKAQPRPDIVIYLSDGDGTAPAYPPQGIHFIWCIVPTARRIVPASWGETIFLSDEVE